MTIVLVTGATGFVGTTLCEGLARSGYTVRAATRSDRPLPSWIAQQAVVGDIDTRTTWQPALDEVDAVVHIAAKVHVTDKAAAHSAGYFDTNDHGTLRLANAAAKAGVRRFIYLSSIKVNGEETIGRAFTARDQPDPRDPYGVSKWHAEQNVMSIAARTRMEAVIVRSPLVYGPGVRANFLRLMSWVDKELPLPLGAVHNARSLVSVWNLCDLLANLLTNPAAAQRTWLVSDGEDLSTVDLIRRVARSMQRRALLLPVPIGFLRLCGGLMGRKAEIDRLCKSLVLNINETRDLLAWSPPVTTDEGLARTVQWYLSERSSV